MNNKNKTVQHRSIAFLLIVDIITAIAVMAIGFVLFRDFTIKYHIQMAEGLTGLVADVVDADRTLEFIEKGHDAPGYDEIEAQIYRLRSAYPDVEYLYVTRIQEGGCYVVFDLATEDDPALAPGEVVGYEDAFLPYIDDLLAGRGIEPIISNDQFGYLLTVYMPILDSNGVCQCYAAADFSMGLIGDYVRTFMVRVALLFFAVIALMFIARLLFMERGLFRSMKKMDTIAFHDALTGMGNKAAYDERARRLDEQIGRGSAEFTIIIVDVNFLKRVNDTFGHEKGNAYLITNAEAITQNFGANDVYRIGGDEFAVILEGEKAAEAEGMIERFRNLRATSYSETDHWNRVCAAVGLARYDGDANVDAVFKRADAAMYRDKVAMKAERMD